MALKSSKKPNGRIQSKPLASVSDSSSIHNNTVVSSGPEPAIQPSSTISLADVVEQSAKNLQDQPKAKRHRRTKAEIEAERGTSGRVGSNTATGGPNSIPSQNGLVFVDRTNEIAPALELYSKVFVADPLQIPDLALSTDESIKLGKVTSNLMNAFPQYFNDSNPQTAAIVGAVVIAVPIVYSKWNIYKMHSHPKVVKSPKHNSTNAVAAGATVAQPSQGSSTLEKLVPAENQLNAIST